MGDVLAPGGDKGRGRLRKARRSRQTGVDPGIPDLTYAESIGVRGKRSELKHLTYLQEQKEKSIPSVAASERGRAQTGGNPGVAGLNVGAERLVERSGKSGHSG